MSEVAAAAAWIAALNTALSPNKAYDFDEAPTPAPPIHVLVTVERRFGSTRRMCGGRVLDAYRLTTTEVGSTVDEARWARDRIDARLEDKPLEALETTRLRLEGRTPIGKPTDDDLGMYEGVTTWTYYAPAQ